MSRKRNSQSPPQAHTDMRRVFAYLIKQRCISREVLSEFTREKPLFEDAEYHNAVFVGLDEKNIARHAHKKSMATDSSFRINVEGSNPAYSFHYISKNPYPHTLFVFEAPIDMLSYISLHSKNWKNASYVALNGVSEQPILKLLEQVRTIDRSRLREYIGHLSEPQMQQVNEALAVSFGLDAMLPEPQMSLSL